jgi:hypothetical protein
MIKGRQRYAHRVVWLLIYGEWPKLEIDHIDGDRLNLRIANLRDVPKIINSENKRRPHRGSRSGVLGVDLAKPGKWRARIRVRGKTIYLGTFDSPELAHNEYVRAKRSLHAGCTL